MSQDTTILIVDDEPAGLETLAALLRAYHLEFASSGPEAIAQAAASPPDLILLDVMMPGMDGFEVCRRLRATPALAEVPIVLVTALDDRDSKLAGLDAGADDFVSKPFDRAELRARVGTITRLNRYRRLVGQRAQLAWVLDHAKDGYVVLDEPGVVRYANTAAGLFLGLDPKETASGQRFSEILARQYRVEPPANGSGWSAVSREAEPQPRFLIRPASANSEMFALHADAFTMDFESDRHTLVRLRDVTATLIEQQSIWSFQSLIRHKLCTGISQTLGSLQLIEQFELKSDSQSYAELFEIALRGARWLNEEINQIFRYLDVPELLNPELGQVDLAELAAVIGEATAEGGPAIQPEYRGIADPGALTLALSRPALRLILAELFENARKFHPRQTPAIEVIVSRAGTGVRIEVLDDGGSLSPAQLAQAWLPYFQGERYFTGQVPGMGLGLPMIATALWRVGGECRIFNRDTQAGVGVALTIPLAIPPE